MSKIKVNEIDKRNGSTLTLGGSGTAVTLACGATQTGFGRTGTVDWQTSSIKTTTFTAANGEGYFADTSSGAITMNLPAATAGNIVSVVDYTNTFQNNGLTITPNGSQKIGGTNASVTLTTEGQSVTLVYVDNTEGWKNVQDSTSNVIGTSFIVASGGTETTSGNCKIHTFTGPGTFTVTSIASDTSQNTVSYLVVAGGGGGSGSHGGGAGGGGFREYKAPTTPYTASPLDGNPSGTAITVTATAFPITVGGGGAAGQDPGPVDGGQGSTSTFSTVSSAGGGGGANYSNAGGSGGSGGGGKSPAGAGNTPPVTPPQGSNGGTGPGAGPKYGVGGGGGATEAGASTSDGAISGRGGAGATTSISGSSLSYSGGGGSGTYQGGTAGAGSPCGTGGAAGAPGGNNPGTAGTANRGGGSGGRSYNSAPGGDGTAGGSGVVVIRYRFQ